MTKKKPDTKELNIEYIELDKLIPYINNAKIHGEEDVDFIAASIKEFGMNAPIAVWKDNVIVYGHGRALACKKLKLKTVPIVRLDHLTDAQRKAFAIADNKSTLKTGFNTEILKLELDSLKEMNFDLNLTGFSIDELSDLQIEIASQEEEKAREETEDDLPEVEQNKFGVKRGDLWQLGRHFLLCGDSTSKEDVEYLMDGKKADITFTSPPYNANTKTGHGDIFKSKKTIKLYNNGYSDNLTSENYIKFAKIVLNNCFNVTDGFIFWNVSYNANSRYEYIKQIEDKLEYLIEQICWKKTSTIPFKGSLMRDWEPIYIFSTNKESLNLQNVVSNHWIISNTNCQNELHKACFPLELPMKGINLIEIKTGIVFEPFCGSGTTLIACEKTNRICYGMELDPHYCSVIIERWQNYTGQKAELISE